MICYFLGYRKPIFGIRFSGTKLYIFGNKYKKMYEKLFYLCVFVINIYEFYCFSYKIVLISWFLRFSLNTERMGNTEDARLREVVL